MKVLRFLGAVLRQLGIGLLYPIGFFAFIALLSGVGWCVGKVIIAMGVSPIGPTYGNTAMLGMFSVMLLVYGCVAVGLLFKLVGWLRDEWRDA